MDAFFAGRAVCLRCAEPEVHQAILEWPKPDFYLRLVKSAGQRIGRFHRLDHRRAVARLLQHKIRLFHQHARYSSQLCHCLDLPVAVWPWKALGIERSFNGSADCWEL